MTIQEPRRGRPEGGRDPLLLVHGFAATGRVWEPVAEDLEDSFEVLAPTLLGHFEAEPFPPGVAPGIEALADWLERELDAVGWDSAHIVGNSLGGWLALELAKRGRARSVVALAPAGGCRPGSRAVKRIERMFTIGRALGRPLLPHAERLCGSTLGRRLLFGQFSAHPERLEPADAAYGFRASMECPVYLDLLRAARHEHARDLDEIRCPVLLAWPAKDRVLPFERYGRPLREALPSAELRMLHDVGHVPMLDDPRGIADLVRDFTMRATGPCAVAGAPRASQEERAIRAAGKVHGHPTRQLSVRTEQPTDVARRSLASKDPASSGPIAARSLATSSAESRLPMRSRPPLPGRGPFTQGEGM
jgi:pimeloyl-ACP methyl ester carboxylesterase